LRRAWRRPGYRQVLRENCSELCILLALPGAHRPPRSGPGGPAEPLTDN
jgi:hypothetical protein